MNQASRNEETKEDKVVALIGGTLSNKEFFAQLGTGVYFFSVFVILFKFKMFTCISQVTADKDILVLAKKAGCLRLRYGVESGDPEILKAMNKNITCSQVEAVFKLTRQTGIEAFGYFMIGYLHDTPESMRRTLDFAKRLDADLVMFTITVPQPKTLLFDQVRAEGIIKTDYWRDFTLGKQVERFPSLVPDAEKWLALCYREFYFRPSFIIKSISKIRDIDAIRRHMSAFLGLINFKLK